MTSLRVVQSPTSEHAYTNTAVVSKSNFTKFGPFIITSKSRFVYMTVADTNCPNDVICLNSVQRTDLRVALDEIITVDRFAGEICKADEIMFIIKERKKNNQQLTQSILSSVVHDTYDGKVVSDGQTIVLRVEDIKYDLTVRCAEVMAMICPSTICQFKKASGSNIKLSEPIKLDFNFETIGVGGMDAQFAEMFRRAFVSRIYPKEEMIRLGIKHVKGMMLYGPPGCGKTLIARNLSQMLGATSVQVVNGPELLNRYVGGSEENVRNLFAQAEKDSEDTLHVIIFDEFDALARSRGSRSDNTGVGDSVVNQLLTKIEGVNALNNILLICMTNRLELIDEALLRPGRLELHIEIGLPDEAGRLQILKIHTRKMKESGVINNINLNELAELTNNYTGAELESVVKAASSYAMYRNVDQKTMKIVPGSVLNVTQEDFIQAISEIRPKFGCEQLVKRPVFEFPEFTDMMNGLRKLQATSAPLTTCLLHGARRSGKSTVAAELASGEFVRLISADTLLTRRPADEIAKVFADAYRSRTSMVIIDDIERVFEYIPVGPRFSSDVIQTLMVYLTKTPPAGHQIFILVTTNAFDVMKQFELDQLFNEIVELPNVSEPKYIFEAMGRTEIKTESYFLPIPVGTLCRMITDATTN